MEDTPNRETPGFEITPPVVVDLGKQKKKRIRQLLRGRGKLVDELDLVIEEAAAALGAELEGKTVVPLVLVYRKKRKRRGWIRL